METYDNTRFTCIEKLKSPRESEVHKGLAITNFKTNMVCKNESTIPQICIKSILFLDAIRSVLRNKGFPNTHDNLSRMSYLALFTSTFDEKSKLFEFVR